MFCLEARSLSKNLNLPRKSLFVTLMKPLRTVQMSLNQDQEAEWELARGRSLRAAPNREASRPMQLMIVTMMACTTSWTESSQSSWSSKSCRNARLLPSSKPHKLSSKISRLQVHSMRVKLQSCRLDQLERARDRQKSDTLHYIARSKNKQLSWNEDKKALIDEFRVTFSLQINTFKFTNSI